MPNLFVADSFMTCFATFLATKEAIMGEGESAQQEGVS